MACVSGSWTARRTDDREDLYADARGDFPDNHLRFSLLSRAALESAAYTGMQPSVVHAHDWQAGLVPAYVRERFSNHPAFAGVGTVFTIHNLAYQGIFGREVPPASRPAVGRLHR